MKILETLNEKTLFELGHDENYFKNENIYVKVYHNCMIIKNLEDAMKRGKEIKRYVIATNNHLHDSFRGELQKYLLDKGITVFKLVESILNENIDTKLKEIFRISIYNDKAVRVFSPFYKSKKIKKFPSKWSKQNVIKAIMSGQIKKGTCIGYYTDDFAFDSANNFGRGEISVLQIAKELVESPSGWNVRESKINESYIELSVNCYSYNSNRLIFDLKGVS